MNILIEEVINDNGTWYTITINGKKLIDVFRQPFLYYRDEVGKRVERAIKDLEE